MKTQLFYKTLCILFITLMGAGCTSTTNKPVGKEVIVEKATAVPTNTPTPILTPKPILSAVTFYSTAFAEDTGVMITFQHPRDWQASHFTDSGHEGWLVSDSDPNDVFWYAFRTEEEPILIEIMPVNDPQDVLQHLTDVETTEFESKGKHIVYGLADDGTFGGVITKDDQTFGLLGEFSTEKKVDFQEGIEIILTTFDWSEIEDTDLSKVWLALRGEGDIDIGRTVDGYVPLGSLSEWTFTGTKDQEICVSVRTHDPEVTLSMDIIARNGNSLMPNGEQSFTDLLDIGSIKIPADGRYRFRLIASTGFIRFMPGIGRASESKAYGWCQILIEGADSEDSCNTN